MAYKWNIWFDYSVEVWKKRRNNVGKKKVCRQQLSLTFQQKRKAWKKTKREKIAQQNEKKLPTKQKMTITNVLRKILQRLVKTQFQQIKQQSQINQIHVLIVLHFHIYNLLCNLYKLTKYNTVCLLSHLKASCDLWRYASRALFLRKWSGTDACPPFNMNWFRCQIVLERVMTAVSLV